MPGGTVSHPVSPAPPPRQTRPRTVASNSSSEKEEVLTVERRQMNNVSDLTQGVERGAHVHRVEAGLSGVIAHAVHLAVVPQEDHVAVEVMRLEKTRSFR